MPIGYDDKTGAQGASSTAATATEATRTGLRGMARGLHFAEGARLLSPRAGNPFAPPEGVPGEGGLPAPAPPAAEGGTTTAAFMPTVGGVPAPQSLPGLAGATSPADLLSQVGLGPAIPGMPVPAAPHPMLRQGSTGPAVVDLQMRLTARGDPLEPDGIFGPLTRAAVVRFQQASALDPDGIVGPLTWAALDAVAPGPGPVGPGQTGPGGKAPGTTPTGPGGGAGGLPGIGGPVDDATRQAIVAGLRDKGDYTPDARKVAPPEPKALVESKSFVGEGEYEGESGEFHFKDPALDASLEALMAQYAVSGGRVMGGEMQSAEAGRQAEFQADLGETRYARGYPKAHPAWAKAFQCILANTPGSKFDASACTAQGLLAAFLQEWAKREAGTQQPHSTVETMLAGVGGSEANDVADSLGAPPTHSYNWCAAASNRAAALGLLTHGLRFDIPKGKALPGDPRPDFGKEVEAQSSYFSDRWAADTGNMLYDRQAFLAPLEPGDRITIVDARSNYQGHVVTVVSRLAAGAEGPFQYVSGNTRKAVRVEESIRRTPPASYSYNDALSSKEPSFSAKPGGAGEAWTTVVTRSSRLDAHTLLGELAEGPYSSVLAELRVAPVGGNLRDVYANVPPGV